MNVEIGTVAAPFLFLGIFFSNFWYWVFAVQWQQQKAPSAGNIVFGALNEKIYQIIVLRIPTFGLSNTGVRNSEKYEVYVRIYLDGLLSGRWNGRKNVNEILVLTQICK